MLYSHTDLTEAYRMVKDKELSLSQACALYGVPRSTLRDRLENRVSIECTRTGPETVFTQDEEKRLCEHLKSQAEMGHDWTRADVTHLATDYAIHLHKRSSDRRLSLHWFYSFMARWPELKFIKTDVKSDDPEIVSGSSEEEDSVSKNAINDGLASENDTASENAINDGPDSVKDTASENAINDEPDSEKDTASENAIKDEPDSENDSASENVIKDEPDSVDRSSEENEIVTEGAKNGAIDFFANRSTVVCKKSTKQSSRVRGVSGGKALEGKAENFKKCTAQKGKKANQLTSKPPKQQKKGKGATLMSLKQCKAHKAKNAQTNTRKPKIGQKRCKEGTNDETYDDCIAQSSKKVKLNRSKVKMLYSPTDLAEAYRMVKDKDLSLSQACALYGVPRSTLRDRLENRVSIECTRTGPETMFTEDEERTLCEHLKSQAEMGRDLTRADVTRLATDYAVQLHKRSSDKQLSLHWFYSFMARWPELNVIKTGTKNSDPETVSRLSGEDDSVSENAKNDESNTFDQSIEDIEIVTEGAINDERDFCTVPNMRLNVSSTNDEITLEGDTGKNFEKHMTQSAKKANQRTSQSPKQQREDKKVDTLKNFKQCKAHSAKKANPNKSKHQIGQKRCKKGKVVETFEDYINQSTKKTKPHSSKKKMLYSPTDLTEAYRMVKEKELSLSQACALYGVPRSTLRDRLENRVSIECTRTGPETMFTEDEERTLCEQLKSQAEMGLDLTRADVTRLATDYAVYLHKRSSDRQLSLHWFYSFMARWPELNVIKTGVKS